jgi:hypothetical protein
MIGNHQYISTIFMLRRDNESNSRAREEKRRAAEYDRLTAFLRRRVRPSANCRFDGSVGVHSVAKPLSGTVMSPMRQLQQAWRESLWLERSRKGGRNHQAQGR